MFNFDELRKIISNFSEANDIGTGDYGKVYRVTHQSCTTKARNPSYL
jgi:hypothetical protein